MCIWRALQCYHHEISLIFIDSRHVFGPAAQLEQVKNFVELLALVGSQKRPSHKGPAKRDQPKGTSQKGPRPKRDHGQKGPWPKGTKGQKGPWPKGTKGQKGPRHKRDHGLFKMLIIEIQIIGIPIFNH